MRRRIFYSSNGTLTDLSVVLGDYYNGTHTFTLVAAQDAIYIGSYLPFNSVYFKLSSVNANASTMAIQYWYDGWRNAVEVIDETSLSGASLGQSGFVSFVPSKDYNWMRESTNYGGETITGLSSVEIYDLYWIKITFNNNLSNDVALSWIGNLFSNDNDFGAEYPDLVRSTVMAAYESGKTNWEEQHIKAGEIIVRDLISKRVIDSGDQILDRHDLTLASVCKVAEIVYQALGDDYADQKLEARREYDARLNKYLIKTDRNQERVFHTGRLFR